MDLQLGSGDPHHGKVKRSELQLPQDTKVYNVSYAVSSLLTETIYGHNLLYNIVQGTSALQRIGDNIHIKGITFDLMVDTNAAVVGGATSYNGMLIRLMIIASPVQDPGVGLTGTVGSTFIFYNTTSQLITARADPRKVKVLCDKVIQVQSRISGTSTVDYVSVDCQVDMPFEFQTGSTYGVTANLYALCMPYISAGVPGTSIAVNAYPSFTVAFSDI